MGWFPRAWGAILPLRWYIQILFDQAARGAPLHQTAEPFAYLCAITAILMALVWLRFRALARTGFAAPSEQETLVRPGSGIGGTFVAEWRRVLGDRGVLGLFILAPMLYAVFYPQPYLGQLVRNIPIAVVDQDNTDLSRGLIQALGAHGNLSIALRATTFAEAEDAIQARRAFGIVGIPPDTERNVLKGVSARLPIYGDSTYFILFNRTLQGILESVQAVVIDAVTASARRSGAGVRAATAATAPVDLVMVPLFNPTASYSAYVVPAAFVLILHQTLLMGAAMLGGAAYETGGPAGRRTRASAAAILGQGLAHWAIYVPAMLLYFVIMPRVYGFSTLGSFWQIVTLSFPFILATSFLGQTLGLVFRHRETAVLLVLATSLPQFFLVGAAWPAEAIPSLPAQRARVAAERAGDRRVCADQPDGRLAVRGPRSLGSIVGTDLAVFPHGRRAGLSAAAPESASCAGRLGRSRCWRASWRWPRMGAWYARSPKAAAPESIPGMVRTTEIKVAPEVSGHLARVLVSRGQHVNRGDAGRTADQSGTLRRGRPGAGAGRPCRRRARSRLCRRARGTGRIAAPRGSQGAGGADARPSAVGPDRCPRRAVRCVAAGA